MSQSIRIQVQLKSFADVKVQGSVTVQDEMSQSIAVAPSGDVSQIEVPVPAQPRFLGLTAQGSDHSGPFFPRRVVLELRPGPTVNHLARTGTLDPEPPITLAPMSSAEGITVRVEVFLPRLREKNLPGFTGTEGVSGTFVNPSSVDHPPPSSWNLIPACPPASKWSSYCWRHHQTLFPPGTRSLSLRGKPTSKTWSCSLPHNRPCHSEPHGTRPGIRTLTQDMSNSTSLEARIPWRGPHTSNWLSKSPNRERRPFLSTQ